ncbi:MAG: hypothetical protein IPI42_08515 [Saprospiraceae bacterium]|nr:hypothetical protein [Candidatus Parvibacillus calidus]
MHFPIELLFPVRTEFRGSVFLLQAGTPCDIAVSIHDSIPEEKVIYQHTVSTSTLNDPETIVGTNIRWVARTVPAKNIQRISRDN